MYLQELVEVAIGLVFAWLLISIATMQVQEIIASVTGKRAHDLEDAIGNMLKDEGKLAEFYNHPLIQSLTEPLDKEKANKYNDLVEKEKNGKLTAIENIQKWMNRPSKPSYIPASTFATVIFDVVTKAGTAESPIKTKYLELRSEIGKLEAGDQQTANKYLDHIADLGQALAGSEVEEFKSRVREQMIEQLTKLGEMGKDDATGNKPLAALSTQLRSALDPNSPDYAILQRGYDVLQRGMEPYLDQVRNRAVISGSEALGSALSSLLAGVEEYATETDKALAIGRKKVETWFDNTMDRMGGWYKRWAQTIAFFIGLVIAIAFNVDSIHIAQELWRNPALRQASATYVQNYVDAKTKNGGELTDTDVNKINTEIQKLDFPIGWNKFGDELNKLNNEKNDAWNKFNSEKVKAQNQPELALSWLIVAVNLLFKLGLFILLKLIGWLITAGATVLGAPFWFDTLKKLVNIRGTGVNPAEKPAESKKTTAEAV